MRGLLGPTARKMQAREESEVPASVLMTRIEVPASPLNRRTVTDVRTAGELLGQIRR